MATRDRHPRSISTDMTVPAERSARVASIVAIKCRSRRALHRSNSSSRSLLRVCPSHYVPIAGQLSTLLTLAFSLRLPTCRRMSRARLVSCSSSHSSAVTASASAHRASASVIPIAAAAAPNASAAITTAILLWRTATHLRARSSPPSLAVVEAGHQRPRPGIRCRSHRLRGRARSPLPQ
jgi:hypothetical protein